MFTALFRCTVLVLYIARIPLEMPPACTMLTVLFCFLPFPSPQGPCATDAANPPPAPVTDASADTSGDSLSQPVQPVQSSASSCPYNTIVAEYNAGPAPDTQPTMNNTEIRKILKFGRPTEDNNGGHIWFGTDGYLYYASGMPRHCSLRHNTTGLSVTHGDSNAAITMGAR